MTRSVDEPDKIQVRARSKGDLVNLKKIALVEVPIPETPEAVS
jgi:hypothetical protein